MNLLRLERCAGKLARTVLREGRSSDGSLLPDDTDKTPLMPCRPSRARRRLRDGKAAVYRSRPFTIILKYHVEPNPQPVEFKADPGSKTTGIALVGHFPKQGRVVLWAANLVHRGQAICDRLESRRSLQRGRRYRKNRYRPPRFLNRTKPAGWLSPSLRLRVESECNTLRYR